MKNGKDYILDFKERETYLYAFIAGVDSFSAALCYWNEIADKVRKHGYKKLLVHENLIGDVSEVDMFELIQDLQKSGLEQIRIAFFDENNEDEKINDFGQLVASNRGADVQIFSSLKDAEKWITSDD